MKLTGIAIRNIKRNRKRSLLSITATALATLVIVFMFSIVGGLKLDMKNIAYDYNTGQVIIRNRNFDEKVFSLDDAVDDYAKVLDLLKTENSDLKISPRIKFPSTVIKGEKNFQAMGVGVNFESEYEFLDLREKITEGVMPADPREVIMGSGLAHELGLSIGDRFTPITLTRKGASAGITYRISALARFSDSKFTNKTFIVSLDKLPVMLRMEGAVSEILIKGLDDKNIGLTAEKINKLLTENEFEYLEALSWKDVGPGYGLLMLMENLYNIIAFVFFALASTVIANTMLMVVFERKKEIGTITSLGMSEKEVVRLFFLEALYLGLIGAAAGVLIGIVLVLPLSVSGIDFSQNAGGVEMGSSFFIFPQINFKSTILVFMYSVFVASFISFFPSRSAAKVDPIVALRNE